jgi:hypothetical protein
MSRSFASRIVISGLVTGGMAAAALGLGAGTASAGGPYTWCPGMPMSGTNMDTHTGGPGTAANWDWSVCHTWYAVNTGMGNVDMGNVGSYIWDGENPPPPPGAFEQRHCPPVSFLCP